MTTTETAPAEAGTEAEAPTLPELIARRLTGLESLGDRLLEISAEPGPNHVAVELGWVLNAHNHLRVLLHLGDPVIYDPITGLVDAEIADDAQEGVEVGAST